jgi:hypothetical protein
LRVSIRSHFRGGWTCEVGSCGLESCVETNNQHDDQFTP